MWGNLPYYPISHFYKEFFGERVYKVSVNVAGSCPVRGGDGSRVCIFCDEWGSASFYANGQQQLTEQIDQGRARIKRRYKAERFLVYFQSYTNSFDRVSQLAARFETALSRPDVVGLVVGTRPDCLPQRLMPVLRKFTERTWVMVELGAQSFFDPQLQFLRRGHDVACTIAGIHRLARETGVAVGLHLMFGLPGETDADVVATAHIINDLPVHNVKLHNLHVLTGTPLAELYARGDFEPISLEDYARRVVLFLRHLAPHIAVQRLAASANRWDELVAPAWTRQKMAPTQFIRDRMRLASAVQGQDARPVPRVPPSGNPSPFFSSAEQFPPKLL